MSPAEEAVRDIYFSAQQNLNMMLAACHSDEERTAIKLQYTRARHNYNAAMNQAFQDGDAQLVALVAKANAAAKELRDINNQLGNIVQVIDVITTAASYGAQIVTKIVAV